MIHRKRYLDLLRRARQIVAEVDAVADGPISRLPLHAALFEVIAAVEVAITTTDWEIAAEAQVMLQQIEYRYRPADQRDGQYRLAEEKAPVDM